MWQTSHLHFTEIFSDELKQKNLLGDNKNELFLHLAEPAGLKHTATRTQ